VVVGAGWRAGILGGPHKEEKAQDRSAP
jgi:hypothetical protein